MVLKNYLLSFKNYSEILVIGPLASEVRWPMPTDTPLVYVDGGCRYSDGKKGFRVGDGDSFSGPLDERLPQEKDHSDLAHVFYAIPEWFTRVHLVGFLGERRDHELFVLGEAHHFLAARPHPTMVTFDEPLTGFSRGDWTLQEHGTFSLWCFETTTISLCGECKFSLPDPHRLPPVSSQGLSNEGFGAIQISADRPFFVHRISQ